MPSWHDAVRTSWLLSHVRSASFLPVSTCVPCKNDMVISYKSSELTQKEALQGSQISIHPLEKSTLYWTKQKNHFKYQVWAFHISLSFNPTGHKNNCLRIGCNPSCTHTQTTCTFSLSHTHTCLTHTYMYTHDMHIHIYTNKGSSFSLQNMAFKQAKVFWILV